MELLNFMRTRALGLGASRSLMLALGLIFGGVVAVAVALFSPNVLAVTLGSIAGLMWFVALDSLWISRVPADKRVRLDLRGDRPLTQRRVIAGVLVAVWLLIAISSNDWLKNILGRTPQDVDSASVSPLLGALTVLVALIAFRIGSATETEREAEEVAYERWLDRQQRKRAAKPSRLPRILRKKMDSEEEEEGQ